MRLGSLLLLAAALAAGSSARAQEVPGHRDLRARARALLDEGLEADRDELLAMCREVMDELPHRSGNRYARGLLGALLRSGPFETEEGWALAMRLRGRVLDELDAQVGSEFLEDMETAYPVQAVSFGRDRLWLAAAAGQTGEAAILGEGALARHPGNVDLALDLVRIHLRLEQPDEALRVCDESIRRTGDARVHLARGALLWRHLGQADAARQGLEAARRAAAGLPENERAGFPASVAAEERALEETVDRATAVREHLAFLDRALIVIGLAWLLYGVRAKRTELAQRVTAGARAPRPPCSG